MSVTTFIFESGC